MSSDKVQGNQAGGGCSGDPPIIIDDGDPGFMVIAEWRKADGNDGFLGDYHYIRGGNGDATATYQFDGISAGTYEIYATWTSHPSCATNVPFTVKADGAVATSHVVNQQIDPVADHVDGGKNFERIGEHVSAQSSITVVISNDANGYVIADAIRIACAD